MNRIEKAFLDFIDSPINVVVVNLGFLAIVLLVLWRNQVRFMFKSLGRNLLRTALTGLAVIVLVFVITLVWSMLSLLDNVTKEKSKNLKAIVTEKWQIPSQMPWTYAGVPDSPLQPPIPGSLADGAASHPGDVRPTDFMTWQFYGGTTDKAKTTRDSMIFFFCMQPRKLLTMMDDLDNLSAKDMAELEANIKKMEEDPRRVVVGRERLQALNKKVDERFSVVSMNYKGLDFDGLEIIGVFPPGRYDQSAVMNCELLNKALDSWKTSKGTAHEMAGKSLNLVWLRVPDTKAYQRVAEQITASPQFSSPAVKCETASSGVGAFLDAYRDLLWIMRWVLVPFILAAMALVISVAISIGVRERRIEIAVLKVLGYSPTRILFLVLGEAILIGCLSGFLSTAGTWAYINLYMHGMKFPIAFFPAFLIPIEALWWGPVLGGMTALIGSIVPALLASWVKVTEVFSRVS